MTPAASVAPDATSDFGRRELNHAETRLALLGAAMELAAEEGLAEMPVGEIARRAGVSRMTFFNQFGEKDGLWLYFASTWWFEDTVRQVLEPLRGFAAIRRVFRRVARADRRHRRFLQGFVGYISRLQGPEPLLVELTPAEKALLRPNLREASAIEVVPMHRQFHDHLVEATEDGEIDVDADVMSLVLDLASALYGEVLMAVVAEAPDLWPRYERQLDRMRAYAATAE